ncbi:MAG TPA: LacI family transcriptional regulator [Clostridiaceae bacterium]|nr:LacI family transcriptional regulator [Clostridiaceae bacterium]
MVSMKDIADKIGVSRTTVSNILNGHTDVYSYKEETIKSVIETADELGYVTNYVAASLKTGKTLTIAIVVPDIRNSYYAHLIKKIESLSKEDNYNLMVCITEEDVEKEQRILLMLRSRMVDGIIISPVSYKSSLDNISQLPPTVTFDRKSANDKIPSLTLSNYEIANKLGLILREQGATKPLFMGGNAYDSTIVKRYEGLNSVFHSKNSDSGVNKILDVYSNEDAYNQIQDLIEQDKFIYDSFFLTTNHFIYGIVQAIDDFKLNIKSIVGLEDFEGRKFIEKNVEYSIIVADQPINLIAGTAYKMLFDLMHNKKVKSSEISTEINFYYNKY